MVTVKLISSTDFPKATDNVGMAGKYMFAVSGLDGLVYVRDRMNMSKNLIRT